MQGFLWGLAVFWSFLFKTRKLLEKNQQRPEAWTLEELWLHPEILPTLECCHLSQASVCSVCLLFLQSCLVSFLLTCLTVWWFSNFPLFPPPQETLNKMLYFLINWPHKRYSLYKALDFLSSLSSLHLVLPVRTVTVPGQLPMDGFSGMTPYH